MTTVEKMNEIRKELLGSSDDYNEEELRELHRTLDACLRMVLRAIVEITDKK